jgi:signal transduction histidine kinase
LKYQNENLINKEIEPLINLRSVKLFSNKIDDVTLFDSILDFNALPVNLKLSSSQNHLTFEFDGLYFSNPENIMYRYKLVGLDKSFITTENNFVVYSSLPYGKYKLIAFAVTNNGLKSTNKIEYEFEIETPFYKRIWFLILIGLVLIAIGILIPYWRIKNRESRRRLIQKLREEEFNKLRQRTAEDFHDEMGNKLTRISILSDVLKSKSAGINEDTAPLIEQIKENVNALYRSSKDIIWSLHPEHDNLKSIAEHIAEIGVDFFSNSVVEFKPEINLSELNNYKVPLDYSRNLQMIAKEIFNNALKHSGASKVDFLIFENDEKFILLQFADNGKGFNASKEMKGNGLKNMKRRAERIGAIFEIQDKLSAGTTIQISLKLSN